MEQIELKMDGLKALYNSDTKTVTHTTKNGVMIESEVPKDWALTRVFQFMESLIKANEVII